MIKLDLSMAKLHSQNFKLILKQELEHLRHDELPLQRGLSTGNFVTDDPFSAMIISVKVLENSVQVKAGIFYQGILSGCSCADDPTPTSPSNEYCVVQLDINKVTAVTSVTLLDE